MHLGPQFNLSDTPGFLKRDFSPSYASRCLGRNVTKSLMEKLDFGHFAREIAGTRSPEGGSVHVGGHHSIGGVLGNVNC